MSRFRTGAHGVKRDGREKSSAGSNALRNGGRAAKDASAC